MTFEIEVLSQRLDVPEDKVWHVINLYWEAVYEPYLASMPSRNQSGTDIRRTENWHSSYYGVGLEIDFRRTGGKLILFGATHTGRRREHLLGYIEIRRVLVSAERPVDVHIVCSWKPLYLFFKEMADAVLSQFACQPIDQAATEILQFKALVERQMYKDIFVRRRAQENIAQALLQTFLIRRSYREVPVRGGQSDILVFDRQGRFLYETKIWKGGEYFSQGLREIGEYITGEDSDGEFAGIFYIIFDSTKSAAARRYRGSDLSTEIIGRRTVHIVIININPPKPSKKKRGQ